MEKIASTYKTEFYSEGQKLFEKDFINLDWGNGSLVSFEGEDYEIQSIYEIGKTKAKADVKLSNQDSTQSQEELIKILEERLEYWREQIGLFGKQSIFVDDLKLIQSIIEVSKRR